MKSTIFNSFEEASAFARSLAIKGINQNLSRNGNLWHVEHDEPTIAEPSLQVQSKREDRLLNKIQSLEEDKAFLQEKIDDLAYQIIEIKADIEDEVLIKLKNEKLALSQKSEELSSKLTEVKSEKDALNNQKRKLELLEKAYAEKFGKAEIIAVKKHIITGKEICSRCGGDGGVRGGCQKCEGTGWSDSVEENVSEVVQFK